ncbi:DUF2334 domain-containing protein [Gammaproteobacteria bacterium]|nr:DUF2334 domain-containing protein [Gammaproteobacteria bacterium]
MKKLILRIDDVSPFMDWDNFLYFVSKALIHGYSALLGVIPNCQDPKLCVRPPQEEFWPFIRGLRDRGFVVAQHGYTHHYDVIGESLLAGRDKSEFATHSYEVQLERLKLGQNFLSNQGLSTDIFMAPGHHFDSTTLDALCMLGFRYITDGFALYPFAESRTGLIHVPQLFSKPHGLNFGVYTTCLHLDGLTKIDIDNLFDVLRRYAVTDFYTAAAFKAPFGSELISKLSGRAAVGLHRIKMTAIQK